MKSTPFTSMHGMHNSSNRLFPAFHSLRINGIRRMSLPMPTLLIIIRVPGQYLWFASDIKLIKIILLRYIGNHDMVIIFAPFQVKHFRTLYYYLIRSRSYYLYAIHLRRNFNGCIESVFSSSHIDSGCCTI